MNKREAAKILYFQEVSQKRISEIFEVAEQTVGTWKREDDWEQKRKNKMLAQETAGEKLNRIILHNIKVMETEIENAEKEGKIIKSDKGDVDALYKLMAAVKGHQETWTHYVRIIREFINHMEVVDINLGKDLLDHADRFLNNKRKELTN